jgi:5-methylcytosine-specific restriction endonuclease McrA
VSDRCALGIDTHPRGTCRACGAPLPGFRRKWCSDACVHLYLRNHTWTDARWEAIRRASGLPRNAYDEGLPIWTEWVTCDECQQPFDGAPEVNHVEPRTGRGYGPGCHHHQTNLQVLCHTCHVAETTRQTRERRGIPPGGRRPPEPGIPIWEAA